MVRDGRPSRHRHCGARGQGCAGGRRAGPSGAGQQSVNGGLELWIPTLRPGAGVGRHRDRRLHLVVLAQRPVDPAVGKLGHAVDEPRDQARLRPPDRCAGPCHRVADQRPDAEVVVGQREQRAVRVAFGVHDDGGGLGPAVARFVLDGSAAQRHGGHGGPAGQQRREMIVQVAADVVADVDHEAPRLPEPPEDVRKGATVRDGVHAGQMDVAQLPAAHRRHGVAFPVLPGPVRQLPLAVEVDRDMGFGEARPVRMRGGERHHLPTAVLQGAPNASVLRNGFAVDLGDDVPRAERAVAPVEGAARDHGRHLHAGAGIALVVIEAERGRAFRRRHDCVEERPAVRRAEFALHLVQEFREVAAAAHRGQEAGEPRPGRGPVDAREAGIVELLRRQRPHLLEGRPARLGLVARRVERDADQP